MVALGAEAVSACKGCSGRQAGRSAGGKSLVDAHIKAGDVYRQAICSAHIHALDAESVYRHISMVVDDNYYSGLGWRGIVAQCAPDKECTDGALMRGHGSKAHYRSGYHCRDDVKLNSKKYRHCYHGGKYTENIRTFASMKLSAIRHTVGRLTDLVLVPPVCPVCGAPLADGGAVMCSGCAMNLPMCQRLGPELLDSRAVLDNARMPLGMVRAWFNYDPESDYAELIRKLKYRDSPNLGTRMGRLFGLELCCGAIPDQAFSELDVLLPLPMHWTKRLRRGYNQTEYIARGLASVCHARVADNLVAVRRHSTQTRLSGSERARNLQGCFELRRGHELDGLKVAIVDDIITTGASMSEALLALMHSSSPASVSLLALGATL